MSLLYDDPKISSDTVSNALEQFGDEDVAETARFVGMMDRCPECPQLQPWVPFK